MNPIVLAIRDGVTTHAHWHRPDLVFVAECVVPRSRYASVVNSMKMPSIEGTEEESNAKARESGRVVCVVDKSGTAYKDAQRCNMPCQ